MKLTITEEDIESGVRGNCTTCPVARAMRREVDESTRIYVGGDSIRLRKDRDSVEDWYLPLEARKWIIHFDQGRTVKPITFELTKEGCF